MDFMDRLRSPGLEITVELRPPQMDLPRAASIDSWFTMHSTLQQLAARGTLLFLTDSAVGTREEENLRHLVTNLEADVNRELACPFMTTKHTLEYCLWYAARVVDAGCGALTVLGGDKGVGPPRCVPHGYVLRRALRERFPALALGGWANPHGDIERQIGFVGDADFNADFYLTQLVSHLELDPVDRFLKAREDAGLAEVPAVFGVFYYRSGRLKTLKRLAKYFPVPVDAVAEAFASGRSAAEVCAATIGALRERGITKFYLSNLHPERAIEQLEAVEALL